ncbi:MAG: hypothetical protein LBH78_01760 [Rickettsiales bacterium]|nr:hypothetical protein [Rickettsiales bacterium]
MCEKQEEPDAESGELQCNVEELTKKNKSLSQELKEAYENLNNANRVLDSQEAELEEIQRRDSGKEKELKKFLLQKDDEIKKLEKDLLKKKKEQVNFMQNMIEYMVSKVEESVKGSEKIRDDDKTVILLIIQEIRLVLEKEVAQYLPETSRMKDHGYESEEDSGYGLPNSCLSTPTKPPDLLWTERCKRSQFRNEGLVKCDN